MDVKSQEEVIAEYILGDGIKHVAIWRKGFPDEEIAIAKILGLACVPCSRASRPVQLVWSQGVGKGAGVRSERTRQQERHGWCWLLKKLWLFS
jgi:hypothetical protein